MQGGILYKMELEKFLDQTLVTIDEKRKVDYQKVINKLKQYDELPTEASEELIDKLLKVFYQAIPLKLSDESFEQFHV